jgi:hypothetical protein
VIPSPIGWRNEPIEFANLDCSRTRRKSSKVVGDIVLEHGLDHMRNIGSEYVPAQRGEGKAGYKSVNEGWKEHEVQKSPRGEADSTSEFESSGPAWSGMQGFWRVMSKIHG